MLYLAIHQPPLSPHGDVDPNYDEFNPLDILCWGLFFSSIIEKNLGKTKKDLTFAEIFVIFRKSKPEKGGLCLLK